MRLSSVEAWMLGSGMTVLLLAALAVNLVMPQFRDMYAGFGADLPALTGVFLEYRHGFYLLPAVVPLAWMLLSRFSAGDVTPDASRKPALVALLVALGLALLMLPLTIVAIYLPIFRLAAVVDG